MTSLKLTAIGNSTGLILPKEMLERLRVGRGDSLNVVETPTGCTVTWRTTAEPSDPAVDIAARLTASQTVALERIRAIVESGTP